MQADRQLEALKEIAVAAGQEILAVYNQEEVINVTLKEDNSPLTEADRRAHRLIVDRLALLTPGVPILSEESEPTDWSVRSQWDRYWLVDPLDGTKEFIKKNGDFTVNIALIDNNKTVFGVIHIPVSNETYWGSKGNGSFCSNKNNDVKQIYVSRNHQNPIRLVASRSHPSEILNDLLEKIIDYEIIEVGSSIKFCLIASGQADCYPRFGLTSEWDIAAGEAIVKSAGGQVVNTNGDSMNYNVKEDYLNPNFIVSNGKIISERILSLINTGK